MKDGDYLPASRTGGYEMDEGVDGILDSCMLVSVQQHNDEYPAYENIFCGVLWFVRLSRV